MKIGVIEAPTVKELFIQRITDMIIKGELKPGDRLPSERELAQQSKISKSAVHLALADLERMGFVETSARHGTFVSDYTRRGNIETVEVLMKANGGSFDRAHTRDMMEMRMALEGKAVELLAQRQTAEDVKAFEADIHASEALIHEDGSADVTELAISFFEFHHDICCCSGNFVLPLIFNTFKNVTIAYWEEAVRKLGARQCVQYEKMFLDVLKEQNAASSRAFLEKEFTLFLDHVRTSEAS